MNKPRFLSRSLCALPLAIAACDSVEEPAPEPPPPWGVPISGGNLLVTRDGAHAVIADPDRDRVLSVALASGEVVGEVALQPNDEPGRLVEDGAGRVHVALRRGGAVVTLDGARGPRVLGRRAVCGEPRGLAYDPATDAVHVACAGGELVTMAAAGQAPTRTLRLDRDLRDVIVDGDRLVVTRFRSAEQLVVDAAGAIVARTAPPTLARFGRPAADESPVVDAIPTVAWRALRVADGRIVTLHQRQVQGVLDTDRDGYSGDCGSPVEPALAVGAPGAAPLAVRPRFGGALPVDLAISASGDRIAVAMAGSRRIHVMATAWLADTDEDPCGPTDADAATADSWTDGLGAPTSVAFTPAGEIVVYYPELPALVVRAADASRTIALPGPFGYDAGRALFHRQTGSGLSCASCHPEGREDGLVWEFAQLGPRRTQSLAGDLLARAPYHWAGDQADLPALMDEVFAGRMAGGTPTRSEKLSLGPWLDRIPAPPPVPGDAAAIARGRALFDSTEVGCASCHAGPLLTHEQRFDVGVGGGSEAFKVPSLRGVAARAPYLHDGCAATLRDRFGPCGGGERHGHTAHLDEAQLGDLIAYLESL